MADRSVRDARAGRSIRAKFLLYAGVVLVASMCIYGIVAFEAARAALLPSIREQLADDAVNVKGGLEEFVTAHYLNVHTWADLPVMRELVVNDIDKTISRFLASVRDDYDVYLDVLALDHAGVCRASSSASDIGRDFSKVFATNVHDLESPPARVPHLAWSREHHAWYLEIAAPIPDPDKDGHTLGVLVAMLDRAALDRVVVPKPGHRYVELRLIDGDRHVLAGAGGPLDGDGSLGVWDFRASDAEVAPSAGRPPFVSSGTDGAGRQLIVAEVALAVRRALPDMGWRLAAAVPTSVALNPVGAVRTRVFLSGSVLVALGLLAAWLFADRISRPIKELTLVAKRIADTGALESVPDPTSHDEVGELTVAFQKMVAAVSSAQEELVQSSKLAFLGELAAGIAHEIRTPLGIIKGSAQMLERRAASAADSEAGEWAVFIREETDRLNRVVTELLDLARPARPDMSRIDIAAVVRRAVQFLTTEASARKVSVDAYPGVDLPEIVCDGAQIYQVCLNLVLNAMQACEPGGRVTVATRVAGDAIEIVVTDDGRGIPEDMLDHLFEPFASKREGGIGLGLAVVRRIVRAHGGDVYARNRKTHGAEFVVRLPFVSEESPDET